MVGKPEGKRAFRRLSRRYDAVKVDLRKTGGRLWT